VTHPIDEFELFYNQHVEAITRYVSRRVPSQSRDDVVAMVFIVAWKKFRTNPDPSLPWLYRIAHYKVLHELRRVGKSPVHLESDSLGEVRNDRSNAHSSEVINAIGILRPKDAELIRLIFWEGLSRSEASQVLGCSVNAVNVRYHRAMVKLRDELGRNKLTPFTMGDIIFGQG